MIVTHARPFGLFFLALCGAIMYNVPMVRADDPHGMHGAGHDELHHWYLTLKQPGNGASCCNNQDCRPTQSRMINGELQVEVDGQWSTVARDKLLSTPSPDLQSHVCASKGGYVFPKGHIFCVVLGSGA